MLMFKVNFQTYKKIQIFLIKFLQNYYQKHKEKLENEARERFF